MPQYKISVELGFAGIEMSDVVEADNLEEAEEIAWQWAVDHVNSRAEEMEEEEESDDV